MDNRVLLVGSHSVVEPLGLMVLSRVAKEEGWDPSIELVRDQDFNYLERIVAHVKPSMIGASVYTGNHIGIFKWLDQIKRQNSDIDVVVGGPHPTLNPRSCMEHADYVVVSEGAESFRKILRGEEEKGIVLPIKKSSFPLADRESFYDTSSKHSQSLIKSIITGTGCPYRCGHCYNSVRVDYLEGEIGEEPFEKLVDFLGGRNSRLFPQRERTVAEVISEVEEIQRISPETRLIFDQSDVHGRDLNWLREFAKEFPRLGINYHALLRFEYADPLKSKSKERVDLMREAGCTGITFAIESGIPLVREEVLKRRMEEEIMFNTFSYLNQLGFKIRTQQMLGLPYGATTNETPVNLEADLRTLELNVRLRQETGLPTMAWASIYTPYLGTATGDYCRAHGFYDGNNDDIHPDFFTRSVLRFPKQWVGPGLTAQTEGAWLSEEGQEEYRDQLQMLRDVFADCARNRNGHVLAKNLVEREIASNADPSKYAVQSAQLRKHLYGHEVYDVE